ncbi:hypothetical protein M422DRAFT_253636 [Sphaerobolus stellatus SS14]|uniref:Uncharacterized protein n=1 Tax=Sphaerobolus stellatus (strain SS14) TaxID=990650 RepID=A0A0C9VMM9_SPHS4|nr:hypothetical protein M422DRAFT_253636 [Sphaerobolus stellatus SS14]
MSVVHDEAPVVKAPVMDGQTENKLVTPLNILGHQTAQKLKAAGIPAINLTVANASRLTFQEIKQGKYRLIVTSPELLITAVSADRSALALSDS